jgi:hypothetical protein
MSLNSFLLCILKFLKGIGKRKKSKDGLDGSVPRPVGGWVCYSLVIEILVETMGQFYQLESHGYRSNSDHGFENLRRNGVA